MSLTETAPPTGRKVRLAAVHYRPRGKSPEANREEFVPLIAEAARQRADLVVLGETLTYFGTGKKFDFGHVISNVMSIDTDYSVTDRLAIKLGIPYVASRYYGTKPHPAYSGHSPDA